MLSGSVSTAATPARSAGRPRSVTVVGCTLNELRANPGAGVPAISGVTGTVCVVSVSRTSMATETVSGSMSMSPVPTG